MTIVGEYLLSCIAAGYLASENLRRPQLKSGTAVGIDEASA
jgi:hypothetical protein